MRQDEVEGVEIENLAIRIIKLVRKKKVGVDILDTCSQILIRERY